MWSFSALNQQQKQALQFQRGVSLQEQSDRVFVASAQDIYALVPVPWQKQVIQHFCLLLAQLLQQKLLWCRVIMALVECFETILYYVTVQVSIKY